MAIALSPDFGYVALVVVLTSFFNIYMSIGVGRARKKYNVSYPTMYAVESENKEAKRFNCVQRGHQNFLETLPLFLAVLILGGLKHPKLAAVLGVVYLVGRYLYFKGYSTGVPENRLKSGIIFHPPVFALIGCTISLAVSLLTAR
ncbi:hypothetical protein R1sor_011420 [Riccia sorocarpa]|uniref:Glutathione S-transferase 3, mitochondrial n=1 Tax=Riccia sorocarpa TaxID=122646 RepID=A0ABD3I2N4_9MARC